MNCASESAMPKVSAMRWIVIICFACGSCAFGQVHWESACLGRRIVGEVRGAEKGKELPAVVYLKNLSAPRLGTESDEAIVDELVRQGHLVLVLDYEKDAK